ncbi:MAG: hypothetical protein HY320_16300 [Armatimonadetes bacterium]|nr:hypothetical protein [Armatimonadota bacterium]
MLSILRQLTAEEQRRAGQACGAALEAGPDAILRALCCALRVTVLGLFPVWREDLLLLHAARRLGVGNPSALLPALERQVLAALLRLAWDDASPEYQRHVLARALELWDAEAKPLFALPAPDDVLALHAGVEALLCRPTGLRALAAALDTLPLPLPPPPRRMVAGLPLPPDRGPMMLYEVLLVVWRARRRLLAEKRAERRHLERHIRQVESYLDYRERDFRSTPVHWTRRPASGAAVAAGAAAAASIQWLMMVPDPLTWVVAGAGIAWSAVAWASRPKVGSDPRYRRLVTELAVLRQRLRDVERAVSSLEEE